MTIVSVTPGNFTPGAQTVLNFNADIINATWEQANTKLAAFGTRIDEVETLLTSNPVADVSSDFISTTPVIEPTVDIPATASTTNILSQFDTKYQEIANFLADKFTVFQNTHFPNESGTYAKAEGWLDDALSNPDSAIPAAVASQILTDDKNRAYSEATRMSDALLATFAARRFPLPPGAAASGVLQIQQKAQEAVADSSRKLMVGYVEQMKFAVQQTLTLRQSAMNATLEYIKALGSGPDVASRVIGVGYDAQSKLISSAASYYGARTEARKFVAQAEQFNASSKLKKDEKNQDVDMALVEERVKALMAEAATLGQIASSLFNNLQAGSGSRYSVSVT